jgi:hypothetical protein
MVFPNNYSIDQMVKHTSTCYLKSLDQDNLISETKCNICGYGLVVTLLGMPRCKNCIFNKELNDMMEHEYNIDEINKYTDPSYDLFTDNELY